MTLLKLTTAASALLLAGGISFAQDSTTAPAKPALQMDCPAPGSVPDAQIPAECKNPSATGTVTQPDNSAATTTTTTPAPATNTAATTEARASSSMLASQFMGQTVWSPNNENVGEINDIVMNKELDTIVAIVGVGGFLGIGEKDVAIPIDQITANKDANNNLTLRIAMTKQQLESAPAFDRTALN